MQDKIQGQLLAQGAAATWLGVPLTTIERIRGAGEIEFVKIGRRYYYSHETLREWMDRATERIQ